MRSLFIHCVIRTSLRVSSGFPIPRVFSRIIRFAHTNKMVQWLSYQLVESFCNFPSRASSPKFLFIDRVRNVCSVAPVTPYKPLASPHNGRGLIVLRVVNRAVLFTIGITQQEWGWCRSDGNRRRKANLHYRSRSRRWIKSALGPARSARSLVTPLSLVVDLRVGFCRWVVGAGCGSLRAAALNQSLTLQHYSNRININTIMIPRPAHPLI